MRKYVAREAMQKWPVGKCSMAKSLLVAKNWGNFVSSSNRCCISRHIGKLWILLQNLDIEKMIEGSWKPLQYIAHLKLQKDQIQGGVDKNPFVIFKFSKLMEVCFSFSKWWWKWKWWRCYLPNSGISLLVGLDLQPVAPQLAQMFRSWHWWLFCVGKFLSSLISPHQYHQ